MDKDKQSIELLLRTPQEVMLDCAARVRAMRIEQNLSQIALAERVGVAVGTIKRFEKTGEIQFHHLLSIALVLGRLEEFDRLFAVSESRSRFSILKNPKSDRGRAENETFRLFEYPWHPSDGRFAL